MTDSSGLLLSATEVAHAFGVSSATVARWASKGQLRCIKTPGGTLRFRKSDVDALLAGDDHQGQMVVKAVEAANDFRDPIRDDGGKPAA